MPPHLHLHRFILSALLTLSACAITTESQLRPGEATLEDVLDKMGKPAMQWKNPDGSMQLSYPHGPAGFRSHMVFLDSEGQLQRIENVMNSAWFSKIQPGMSQSEVHRLIGPSIPAWTVYFAARRELVWEWRYCDDWNNAARFDVLFDNDTGKVRSTLSWREICFSDRACYCNR